MGSKIENTPGLDYDSNKKYPKYVAISLLPPPPPKKKDSIASFVQDLYEK